MDDQSGDVPEQHQYQNLALSSVPADYYGRPRLFVLLWQIVQATVFACTPQPAYAWRRWLLRRFGAKVGRGVLVRQTVRITYPWNVTLGDYCWIGDHVELYSHGPITIGQSAVISQRSYLCTSTHNHADIAFPIIRRSIVVEPEAWVAADSFIAPGVRIGRGSIVAARSTVLRSVAAGTIVSGNPAKFAAIRRPSSQSVGVRA